VLDVVLGYTINECSSKSKVGFREEVVLSCEIRASSPKRRRLATQNENSLGCSRNGLMRQAKLLGDAVDFGSRLGVEDWSTNSIK
jgi:hypothetical protein